MESDIDTVDQLPSQALSAFQGDGQAGAAEPLLEPPIIRRKRALVHDLIELVAECVALEPEIETRYETRRRQAEEHYEGNFQQSIVRFASDKDALENEIQQARRIITARYETQSKEAEKEFTINRRRIIETYEEQSEAAKSEYQETKWTITAVNDGAKSEAEKALEVSQEQVDEFGRRASALRHDAQDYLKECRLRAEAPDAPAAGGATMADVDPLQVTIQQLELTEAKLKDLKSLKIPRLFRGTMPIWIIVAVWLVALGVVIAARVHWPTGFAIGTGSALVLGSGILIWLYVVAKGQAGAATRPLFLAVARAEGLLDSCREQATLQFHRTVGEAAKKYKKELRQITRTYRTRREELKAQRIESVREFADNYRSRRLAAKENRSSDWSEAAQKYRRQRVIVQKRFDAVSRRLQEDLEHEQHESEAQYEALQKSLTQRWEQGLEHVKSELSAIDAECNLLCPAWNDPAWAQWSPPDRIPPALRFGEFHVRIAEILANVPASSRLRSVPLDDYRFPALMAFPNFCSMLIQAADDGKVAATQVIQTVMLRLLAELPPGKLRFMIMDPVGLGRNFASFMHLADYDEALVTSRIWTETPHIEQKLADLTEHMETVIQKYLRDQFPTIEDYNVHAQEVAEPYRFLVVANFPVNFSVDAVRRLVSIIQSGPRCGVYTLISVDTGQPAPLGFSYAELEHAGAIRLDWQDGEFKWGDHDFGEFPLILDPPPGSDFSARLLRRIGEKAKEAKRVEVPFEYVAPAPGQLWSANSSRGIDIPLGRVGATKRQHLRLGHGTSQHVLIAGKTGSGKSTFLHALISNLSLYYSPQEIELYLIDFKKGVEFKTYANHELPHARVIAIESEREFGLSVLQRLDVELRRRAEIFRATGAQDIASYRDSDGHAPLPRIMLIVDEFQEFFVEDDKIASDASLLLDRLVRQGRAFGLHVLLGSQTLGGAYTLARSTVDQMAVRIALQCSEADAHLILSHDNSAARLLSRPGEAIYNDANGLIEGNNPFQIVWLSDERREVYLDKIQELASKLPSVTNEPQIVFEGNAPADIRKNAQLSQLIHNSAAPGDFGTHTIWLGEAIAIKDPTAVVFTPQSGSNFLIVGQNDTAALGILTTALVSLALQFKEKREKPGDGETMIGVEDIEGGRMATGAMRVYVLDGSPEDSPHAGYLAKVVQALGPRFRFGSRRELPSLIAQLAAEANRRVNENPAEPPALFLVIYGLHRFRDLRRQEDDFSFSSQSQDKQNPASQFAEILREGPAVGIHTLCWCDSLNNLNRTFDRQSLREFELRALFQMSSNDSSTLIDSPLASRLGLHRALFCSEEQGKVEKFRPYGLPPAEWLESIQKYFDSKNDM
jgi:hypothetical protein